MQVEKNRVVAIGESEVKVDGNHPLAGMTLNFDITVQSIREATTEERRTGRSDRRRAAF